MMVLPDIWPKELRVHYHRIDERLRERIINRVKTNTTSNLDNLKRFLIVLNKMTEEELEVYKNNEELLFLLLNAKSLEGKKGEVLALIPNYSQHPGILNVKAHTLISARKFDEAPKLIAEAKKLSRETDPLNYLWALLIEINYRYYTESLEKISEQLVTFDQDYQRLRDEVLDDSFRLALLEIFIQGKSIEILLKRRKGKLKEGVQIGKELIDQARTLGNRVILQRLLNNTALCLIESGDLREGLEFLEEAFTFSKILGNNTQLSSLANNIGFIYRNRGELEKSLDYFKIAFDYAKKANIPILIVASQTNIAHLLLDFNKSEQALEESEEALRILKENPKQVPPQIKVSLNLCRADIFEKLDELEKAKEILDFTLMDIKQAQLDKEVPKINLRKALLAIRGFNLGIADELLEETLEISLTNNYFENIVNAKLQSAQIDLFKYRMTNQEKLLDEAIEKIEDLEKLCLEQDYKLILIDIYLLQGLLFSLIDQQRTAINILQKAVTLSQELALSRKEKEAKGQLEEIREARTNLWKRISERISNSIRSTFTFESVAKPKVIGTRLKAFLIFTKESSLPIYQYSFVEGEKIDGELLSGLLSAIKTMGERILDSKEGGLKLIDHGDVAIMLEMKHDLIFALVLTKEIYLAREQLRSFAEQFSQKPLFQDSGIVITRDEEKNKKVDKLVQESFEKIAET